MATANTASDFIITLQEYLSPRFFEIPSYQSQCSLTMSLNQHHEPLPVHSGDVIVQGIAGVLLHIFDKGERAGKCPRIMMRESVIETLAAERNSPSTQLNHDKLLERLNKE